MIATDSFGLDLYQYKDKEGLIDCDRLIVDILKEQEKIVRSLPSCFLKEAEERSRDLQEEIFILCKDNQFKALTHKEAWNSGYYLLDEMHEFYGWNIILTVGEEKE
jgi:hypothetical protein